MAGGDENSPADMGAFINNVGRIRHALSSHVLTIHHSGKDATRGARGHSSLKGAADTEIEVTKRPDKVSVAKITKQKDGEDGQELAFRLEVVEIGENRRGKPVTSCVVRDAEAPVRDPGLTGDEQTAFALLQTLIEDQGRPDAPGTPEGTTSVPEAWWRERFYKAKGAATGDAKRKAFGRVVKRLEALELVKLVADRVWLLSGTKRDKAGHCPAEYRDKAGHTPKGVSRCPAPSGEAIARQSKTPKRSAA
jgi:hypothetical protein